MIDANLVVSSFPVVAVSEHLPQSMESIPDKCLGSHDGSIVLSAGHAEAESMQFPSNKSGGSYSLGTPDLSVSRSFEPSVSDRDLSSQTKRGLLDQAAPTRNRFSKKIRIENSQPELPLATMFFSGLEGKWKGQQRKKIVLKRV